MKGKNNLRIGFAVFYFCTSLVNIYLGWTNPEILRGLADTALIGVYERFALNAPLWHLQGGLFAFAFVQIIIAILLMSSEGRYKVGVFGAMLFHIAIIPWGIWSLWNLLFLPFLFYLWKGDFLVNAFLTAQFYREQKNKKSVVS